MKSRNPALEMLSTRSELAVLRDNSEQHNDCRHHSPNTDHERDVLVCENHLNKNDVFSYTEPSNQDHASHYLRNRFNTSNAIQNITSNTGNNISHISKASMQAKRLGSEESKNDSDQKKYINGKKSTDTVACSLSNGRLLTTGNIYHDINGNRYESDCSKLSEVDTSKYTTESKQAENRLLKLKRIDSYSYLFQCGSGAIDADIHNNGTNNEDNGDADEYERNIEGNTFVAVNIDDNITSDETNNINRDDGKYKQHLSNKIYSNGGNSVLINDESYKATSYKVKNNANKGIINNHNNNNDKLREAIEINKFDNDDNFGNDDRLALLKMSNQSSSLPHISVSSSMLSPTNTEVSLLSETDIIKNAVYETARLHSMQESTARTESSTLPLWQSLLLASIYVFASICYFLCIRHSKASGSYNSAFLVLAIEFTKLLTSAFMKLAQDRDGFMLFTVFTLTSRESRKMWREGLPYAVPSLLYAVYNNLTFFNLSRIDPGTYQILMQTRILFTGILFTFFLKTDLSVRKWLALLLLTVGVTAKYVAPGTSMHMSLMSVILILLQALLSALAGVYNEYVLKKQAHLSIHYQNFFMYFYALFFNIAIGVITDPSSYSLHSLSNWSHLAKPIFIPIVLFGASNGLAAAFILKFINVIVKAFASAVEVLLTAVLAALVLNEKLTANDVIAAVIVMISVYIYYTNGKGDSKVVRLRCC